MRWRCRAGQGGASANASHVGKAPAGEIDLTTLSAQQLRPVGAKVDEASIRLHPQLVRLAGVGTDGFTSAEPDSSATSSAQAPSEAEVRRELLAFRRDLQSAPGVPVGESALAGAGLLSSPLDSTRFEHWGAAGPGRWITVYANAGHAFMVVAGLRFDTSARSGPRGTRWQPLMRSTAGIVARHPPGL